ncbi:MAG: conserved hypothetical protein [Methanobrevibacter sp. CfCl-M3]
MGKVGSIIKVFLVLVLMLVFFEAGLIGSYTIVTSEVPDIQNLVNMQAQSLLDIFNKDNLEKIIVKDPNVYQISNRVDVGNALKGLANVDGVNVNDMNATSNQTLNRKPINVEIVTFGYSGFDSSGDEIIIKSSPDLKVVASAVASYYSKNKVKIDISTIKIISVVKIN